MDFSDVGAYLLAFCAGYLLVPALILVAFLTDALHKHYYQDGRTLWVFRGLSFAAILVVVFYGAGTILIDGAGALYSGPRRALAIAFVLGFLIYMMVPRVEARIRRKPQRSDG